ncbi:MAG: tail fiber protein [Aliiglaciecola sp.]
MNKRNIKSICKIVFVGLVVNLFAVTDALSDQPFIGEIRTFPYNFCPRGWAETNGQLLPIAQNTALFSVIGTTFGGDGRTTLGLPDLQGRLPLGFGTGPGFATINMGQKGGAEQVSLIGQTIPSHSHTASTTTIVNVSTADGNTQIPLNGVLADDGRDRVYNMEAPDSTMNAASITSQTVLTETGNAAPEPVSRRQPYLSMRYCIAVIGIFPSRS